MVNLLQLLADATSTLIDYSKASRIDLWAIFRAIESVLTAINNWLYSNIGVYLFDLLKLIGRFFIWILRFVIEIIQQGLSFL